MDRGGTFTDVVGAHPAGALHALKSSRKIPAPIAMRRSTASGSISASAPAIRFRAGMVGEVRMARRVATNALLERKGEPAGARHDARLPRCAQDRLSGTQENLRHRDHQAPRALYSRSVELDERCSPTAPSSGRSTRRQRAGRSKAESQWLRGGRHRPDARLQISAHEAIVARIRTIDGIRAGIRQPRGLAARKYVGRGDTTVIDAYLSPVLGRYVAQVRRAGRRPIRRPLMFMSRPAVTAAGDVPGQGCDPLGTCWRCRRPGADGRAAGFGP